MTVQEMSFEEGGRMLEWVDANVFRRDTHNKHSPERVAGVASKELKMDITAATLLNAMAEVCYAKNFNLAKYPYI
jgi:hypothetical protein